jgi:tetratricopeptide (TPR) repeat protein
MRYNLGLAYTGAGNYPEARDTFRQLLKMDPSFWDAYYDLGKILVTLQDKSGAKAILQELLAKQPNYPKRKEVEKLLASL